MSNLMSVSLSLTAHQKLTVLAQPQPQKTATLRASTLALVNRPAKEAVPPLTTLWHLGSLAARARERSIFFDSYIPPYELHLVESIDTAPTNLST